MLSDHGEMLGLDAGFCAIMRSTAEAMIGRGVLDFTWPDDRQTCRAAMVNLRQTGEPFAIRKRMQRGDGSIVWVEQVTSLVEFPGAAPAIFATFRPIADPADAIHPGALLDQARFLCETRAERRNVFFKMLFANPSWDLLLMTYVAEAEGRAVDIATMGRGLGVAPAVALRWARALAAEGLLEKESGDRRALAVYRITADAHARLELYLTERLRKLLERGVLA